MRDVVYKHIDGTQTFNENDYSNSAIHHWVVKVLEFSKSVDSFNSNFELRILSPTRTTDPLSNSNSSQQSTPIPIYHISIYWTICIHMISISCCSKWSNLIILVLLSLISKFLSGSHLCSKFFQFLIYRIIQLRFCRE